MLETVVREFFREPSVQWRWKPLQTFNFFFLLLSRMLYFCSSNLLPNIEKVINRTNGSRDFSFVKPYDKLIFFIVDFNLPIGIYCFWWEVVGWAFNAGGSRNFRLKTSPTPRSQIRFPVSKVVEASRPAARLETRRKNFCYSILIRKEWRGVWG